MVNAWLNQLKIKNDIISSMYANIKDFEKIHFSSCEGCEDSCCSSSMFIMAPLILEDIELVYNYFPIYFASIDDEIRLVIIMSGKEDHCPYLKDNKCAIYDSRPPTCHLYPLSPYFDEIFIDTACKAVGLDGIPISNGGEVTKEFYNKRFDNFLSKLNNTKQYISQRENELKYADEILGIKLYNYVGDLQDSYKEMIESSTH